MRRSEKTESTSFVCSNNISGGYSDGVPPLPIPNREVKPDRADGTAHPRESRSPPFYNKPRDSIETRGFVFQNNLSRSRSGISPPKCLSQVLSREEKDCMVSYQFVRFYIKAREGCVHAKEVNPLVATEPMQSFRGGGLTIVV